MRFEELRDLAVLFLIALLMVIYLAYVDFPSKAAQPIEIEPIETTWEPIPEEPEVEPMRVEVVEVEETEPYIESEDFYDDLELLAYCVMAEAGNQEELGKRLVIDTVLNRVDNKYFPDTVREVIYAPGQFEVVARGTLYKNTPTDDIFQLIGEEIAERTNDKVIYFTAGGYNPSGEPWQKVGDHYFSYIRKGLQE